MGNCNSQDDAKGSKKLPAGLVIDPAAKESKRDLNLQFVLIGTSNVGKSALLHRFADDKFIPEHGNTIGVDYRSRSILLDDRNPIKIQIWDTAGQERFRTLGEAYYRRAHGILLVYDITDQKSFDEIETWVNDVAKYAQPNVVKILVGNKSDLDSTRVVEVKEGQALAKKHNMEFFETSAKQSQGVEEAFGTLARQLLSQNRGTTPRKPRG